MFPGPVRPFGVVKLGPDVGNSVSGYRSTGNVVGFSMMHESGTGGTPKYGVVSQLPVVGNVSNPLMDLSIARASPDQAQVGYFNSSLSSGVLVELAATEHAAMYQYTFPSNGSANVVVDLSHVLSAGVVLAQNYVAGNVTIFPDGHYEGSATYGHGWNEGELELSRVTDARLTSQQLETGPFSSVATSIPQHPASRPFPESTTN